MKEGIIRAFCTSAILIICIATYASAETAVFRIKTDIPALAGAASPGDKIAGHREVIESLRDRAFSTQSELISDLTTLKRQGRIESFRPFWIANVIAVTADPDILNKLSLRSDVAEVFENLPVSLIVPVETGDAEIATAGHETGLSVVGAPEVWDLGLDGSGSIVCNFDTGVNGNHPALLARYRGNNGHDGPECWFDPYSNTQYPVDLNGHGSHTMGTMIGLVDGDTIGVAPGAQWIAAAVVDRGGGIQRSIIDILAAFEWAADPDGDPSTTDDVPDVVNNSWGIPLGYYPSCNETFWESIDNLEAAGVVCLFAAGNEGPYPGSIRTPADRIATEFNCFSVGAVNGNIPDLPIASFSSRGPSGCDDFTIKPEVTAPGVSIRSANRTGGYSIMSGTSMATPHVSGAVAILRQFNPNATPPQVKQALMYSARDLGWEGEDNDYGWGVIDIRRALNFMPPPEGIFPAMLDLAISGDGIVEPGEEINLDLIVENLGRPAVNLTATLFCADPRATVQSGSIHIDSFDHNDTLTIGSYEVYFGPDISIGDEIFFTLEISDAGDIKELSFGITVGGATEPGVATHNNGEVAFSVSNIGQFGLGPGSVHPLGGEGFKYPSNGLDFLKCGSLVLMTDQDHISDGALSHDPLVTDDDFAPSAGGYPRITEPGVYSDQDGFAVYSDSAAENPIGLEITQRSFCWTGSSAAPFVIVEFTVENSSNSYIDSIFAGIFCDWDLPLSSANDDIVGYIDYASLGYVTDLSSGVSVGVRTITTFPYSYAAIDNAQVLYDGFSDIEKYSLMMSRFGNVSYDAPGNYSHLIAVGPYAIPPGEFEIIAFSFVAGDDLDELIENAELSFATYPGLTGIAGDEPLPESHDIISNFPNPFNGCTVIELNGIAEDNLAVEIYDITGRLVRSIATGGEKRVVWDGTDGKGNDVAAGIYFARLSTGESAVRKMVYLK